MNLPEAVRAILADDAGRVAEVTRELLVSLEIYQPADLAEVPTAAVETLGGSAYLATVLEWRRSCIAARFAGQPAPTYQPVP